MKLIHKFLKPKLLAAILIAAGLGSSILLYQNFTQVEIPGALAAAASNYGHLAVQQSKIASVYLTAAQSAEAFRASEYAQAQSYLTLAKTYPTNSAGYNAALAQAQAHYAQALTAKNNSVMYNRTRLGYVKAAMNYYKNAINADGVLIKKVMAINSIIGNYLKE